MTSNLRQDVDFNSLFTKLGHSLEEIRVRALKNILCKLDHCLICEADLVHERHLLIRLLEWFNFQPCPLQTEVLQLMLRLAKHTPAAETILSVGGLEFLTNLRHNCAVSDQPIIDQLMECLMRLPNENRDTHTPECFYQGVAPKGLGDPVPSTGQPFPPVTGYPIHQSAPQYADCQLSSDISHSLNNNHPGYPPADTPVGYFAPAVQSDALLSPTDPASVLPRCFKMTTFPWLPLTSTDRHVLSSTNSSVQSGDSALLTSACEFLSDVVFQDFPAEVFLQRPTIVKSLLSLLSGAPPETGHLPSQATQTLTDLTTALRARVLFYQDPALYTPKQDFSSPRSSSFSSASSQSLASLEPRPPAIGHSGHRHRGDGRDQDSSSNNSTTRSGSRSPLGDPEDTDAPDTEALQLAQMTLPLYSVLTIHTCLPLLKRSSPVVVSRVLHLTTQTLGLLGDCLTQFIWEDNTAAAREIVEKLEEILEMFGELLHFNHHVNWSHGPQRDTTHMKKETEERRVVYLGLCSALDKLLSEIVPVEQASAILPDVLVSAIADTVHDESMGLVWPNMRHSYLSYLEAASPERHTAYKRAVDVCKSIESSCLFLMDFDPQSASESYVPLGLACVDSIPHHRHLPLVEKLVTLCSVLCLEGPPICYQPLLLKLLSHPSSEIRVKAYQCSYSIVTSSLSVEHGADPQSTAYRRVAFLLDTQILQEVVYCGLANENKEVQDVSSLMLTHLLQSELLMSCDQWKLLLSALLPVLPVLQGYLEIQTSLGSCVMSLIEPELKDADTRLPPLERFRGCLRLMLSADTKCRAESLKRLAWFLSNEPGSHRKLPSFSDLDVTNITNLFIVQSQRTVEEDDAGQTIFKVEGMQKVYGIFVSETVEQAVRKSAIDQLSIILQDSCLHPPFVKEGGLERVLETLELGVTKGDNSKENFTVYVPACLKILRHLTHCSSSLRHRLAHEAPIYYNILRGALLYHENPLICYEASHLLTLLLFDEAATFQIKPSSDNRIQKQHRALSLPAPVVKRYRLPFSSSVHYDTSPHQVASVSDLDPLLGGMPAEMLRVSWNVAWYCGIDKLLSSLKQPTQYKKCSQEFPSHLRLSPTERVVLLTTDPQTSLQQALYDISNATSHHDVTSALRTLTCPLTTPSGGHINRQLLHQLDWHQVIGRFLRTVPSSTSDETLLYEVLQFISMLLKSSNQIPCHILQWLVETVYHPSGPLIGLLSRSHGANDGDVNLKRQLDKQLLSFISTYSRKLPPEFIKTLETGQLRGNLSHKLLLRLNVAEAPHFYNLAMLEGTLNCLMTITARPGWSVECTDLDSTTLCSQLLNSLLEVVSAFHIGRGGTSMSYMGKGVTKAATLCLRQLAYEMATSTDDKEWPKNWLYSRQGTDAVGEPGLNWMLTLWAYRDPEVRAAGLGIAVALTSTEPGRVMLTSNCKHIPGGIWGAAFSILLDQSECSMVRQQAALLLVNLTSQSMPSSNHGNPATLTNNWQGPIVTDTEYDVSLVGLPALLALLHHSQFYVELGVMCENYLPQPAIHPVSLATHESRSQNSSRTTSTTLEASTSQRPPMTFASHGTQSAGRQLYTSTPTEALLHADHRHLTSSRSGATPLTTTSVSTASATFDPVYGNDFTESVSGEEHQGVATPSLLSAVNQLLRNLVLLAPIDTLNSLKQHSVLQSLYRLIDVDLLDAYCTELCKAASILRYELVFADLCRMLTSLVKLTQVCLDSSDPDLCMDALRQEEVVTSLPKLCGMTFQGLPQTKSLHRQLQTSIYCLFAYILSNSATKLRVSVAQAVAENWSVLMANLHCVLSSGGKDDRDLYLTSLQFLAVLLSTEGKLTSDPPISWRTLLDKGVSAPDQTSGSVLCGSLLRLFEGVSGAQTREKTLVISCFKLLLALSHSAKSVALQAGLVESLVNQMRELGKRLSNEPLRTAEGGKPGGKKKEEPATQELVILMNLLKNFLYEDIDVKTAAYHSGLSTVVHCLWTWCLLTPELMTSALSLLTTFTSKYPTGATSLACTSPSSMSVSPPSGRASQPSSQSLVHAVVRLAQNDLEKSPIPRCKSVFTLLAGLALSPQCRNILWKSNLLADFSKLNPLKQKKTKWKQAVDLLWLDLILNLSFSTEGQQMICKINDSVPLLLEFGDSLEACKEKSLLILRNLCFHTANKPKLLSYEGLIPFLTRCLWSDSSSIKAVASSALCALAFNNQKAKVALKNANMAMKAREALNNFSNTSELDNTSGICVNNLRNLIATISD